MLTQPPPLPKLPGVYLFKDSEGRVLYVGKARSLAQRVASYFNQPAYHNEKIVTLLRDAITIEHIVTRSERDALLLEEHLVKLHQPPYNVLLSSGQPFLYLLITDTKLPDFVITRATKKKGDYWGPFVNHSAVRRAHDYLVKTFQLIRCTASIPQGCLKYHLGICAGICTGTFNEEAYKIRIELVRAVLNGDTKAFQKTLQQAIAHAHTTLAFEQARQLHAYAEHLDEIFATIRESFSPQKYRAEITHVSMQQKELKQTLYAEAEHALKQLLNRTTSIHTIDCFDISHHQSRHIVGSCIRFIDGVPDRSSFRRFKIKTLTIQNDYAALQEIVTRRYKQPDSLPDLILIDGGKGQLNAVRSVVPHAQVISLAKREERLFLPQESEGIVLDQASAMGRLLIALRNYAHHFAITYHTLLKKKEINTTPRTKKGRA